jgi:hypothetical protein
VLLPWALWMLSALRQVGQTIGPIGQSSQRLKGGSSVRG